jgi:amino acid transporter
MGLGEIWIRVYAVCVILILSAINYIGVKQGSMLQSLITLGKILVIAFLIIFGFIAGTQVDDHFSAGTIKDATLTAENFFLCACCRSVRIRRLAYGGLQL